MSLRNKDFPELPAVGVLGLLAMVVATAGCPQPIQVAEGDLLPDAAVHPMPPRALCKNTPREVGTLPASAGGGLLATLARTPEKALLVRVAKSTGPAKLNIEAIGRDGTPSKLGVTTETGAPAPVLAVAALATGGNIVVALTRPEGRIDLLTLGSDDGATKAPPQTLTVPGAVEAGLIWYENAPLVRAMGKLYRGDGSLFEFAGSATSEADGGPADEGDGGADAGSAMPIVLPPNVRQVVVANDTLGWLRSDESGLWLDHLLREQRTIVTTQVAPVGHDDVRLLWAGDRYVVGDTAGGDLARYTLGRRSRRAGKVIRPLRLGGRMRLPRPPNTPAWTVWDNAGARHLGIAQRLGPRHLRFTNIALGGLVLDSAMHLQRERDIVGARVAWDGHGYVLIWGEQAGEAAVELFVTRFSCPDDA